MAAQTDVVVAGAGMVGCATALALADAGLTVTLLERHVVSAPSADAPEPVRVSAINESSCAVLTRLGVWQRLDADEIGAFERMDVSDGRSDGAIHFDGADVGEPALGYILFNHTLQARLLEAVRESADVTFREQAEIIGIEPGAAQIEVLLAGGDRLQAGLLVGADGTGSTVRRLAGIDTRGWPYEQTAVVASVEHERPHDRTARQVFVDNGPLAFLPLADGRSSIVWSTSPTQAEALMQLDERGFLDELEQTFGPVLGAMRACGRRAAFPLRLQHATAYVKPRIALVGDAAHTVHPLAGQGVNLGFLDAAALVAEVCKAVEDGRDFGGLSTLRPYERWRKGGNLAMMAALDGLQRLFDTRLEPLAWLRGSGLSLTNRLPPVKNVLARHAMGLSGELPPLAQRPHAR